MRISRIIVKNFRNFHKLDVKVGRSAVILGENQIGKTNLLYALRLVLDPSLPDSARQLRIDDFWDGIQRPISAEDRILISVDIADFDDNYDHLAVLGEHLIQPKPMVSRLTYEFGLIQDKEPSTNESDFEFSTYGGDQPENRFGYEVRKRIPLEYLSGLRDVEGDLSRWSKSPLKPLIERAKIEIEQESLNSLAASISEISQEIANQSSIQILAEKINGQLKKMAGENQVIKTDFGFSATDPEKLLRSLRLFFDEKKREISEASLGTANVLYLALRSLELELQVSEKNREHTFFCIEEPEAHLHPHLQRLVYRNYLKTRSHMESAAENENHQVTHILTTHSPHIASVSPVKSLILLKKSQDENATIGVSGKSIDLSEADCNDIERYLDVSRAEGLFGRGIILVEGDAEKFLVPVFAERAGYNLDSFGITVCSVGGTNFEPYVKFFGPQGLGIPLAIITDLDLYQKDDGIQKNWGIPRAHSLLPLFFNESEDTTEQESEFYEEYGIFLNRSTLEIELNDSGLINCMRDVMQELCTVRAAIQRFQDHVTHENVTPIPDPKRFIKDIEYVGKGRFAQRLCEKICDISIEEDVCPPYIMKAIKYVIEKLSDRIAEAE